MATNPFLIMKKGSFVQEAPEFQTFKRQNITKWGVISNLFNQLEKTFCQYLINLAYIDVHQVLYFTERDQDRYTLEELLSCVTNRIQVEAAMKDPRVSFKGQNGPVLAAIKIQTAWRRYKAYSAFSHLKFLMEKATIIQRKYRLYMLKRQTKDKVNQFNDQSRQVWREMQEEFKRCWPDIKQNRRVEIHCNSFSIAEGKRLSMEKLKQKENAQIMRIFSVKDPNVDVIYVCPFSLTSEVYKYYMKILELVEIEEPARRFHLVVPENYPKFRKHLSLA